MSPVKGVTELQKDTAHMLVDPWQARIESLRKAGQVQCIPVLADDRRRDAPQSECAETLDIIGPVPMPMNRAGRDVVARWYVVAPAGSGQGGADRSTHVSVLAFGDLTSQRELPLVRIHSTCFTGDVLGSRRCDCGPQLTYALQQMSEHESGGLVVYMAAHEGRGIGLWSKAAAYLLQDEGQNTYEANRSLGFAEDQRDFRYAAAIIRHLLGDQSFRLLTNNPNKISQLRAYGLCNVVQQNHVAGACERNRAYLRAKVDNGHSIPMSVVKRAGS